MWWESIPPAAIIVVGLWIPQIATKGIHTLMFDHPYRRDMTLPFQRLMFFRDAKIGGNPWNLVGLEALPDEPQKVK